MSRCIMFGGLEWFDGLELDRFYRIVGDMGVNIMLQYLWDRIPDEI